MKIEDRILSEVLRFDSSGPDNGFQALLNKDLDWAYVLERSKREGIASLLYFYVNRLEDTSRIPSEIIDALKNIYYNCSLMNLQLEKELAVVVKDLEAEGISPVILKGIFLAQAVYKNIGLRPAADIDLLIKKEDLPRVDIVLGALGYYPPPCYGDFLLKKTVTTVNSLVYNKTDGGFYIHLHWHLVNATWPLEGLVSAIDMGRVWSCAQAFDLNGCRVMTLSPAHLLIYLLYHAFQHYYDRLIFVSDIVRTLKTYEEQLDQNEVVSEAGRFGLVSVSYHSLQCVRGKLQQEDSFVDKWVHIFSNGLSHRKSFFYPLRGEVASYVSSYKALCLDNRGLLSQFCSLWRTLFPSRYAMAHALSLPVAGVRFFHYYQRLKNNILNLMVTLTHCP